MSLQLSPELEQVWTHRPASVRLGQDLPRCSECGQTHAEPLVAASHLLVMRALEVLGKRIVQRPRSRWDELGYRPVVIAHTIWPARQRDVEDVLLDAWNHVPALVMVYAPQVPSAIEVVNALDRTTREAVAEQRCVSVTDVRVALTPIVLS